jgi:hypothetical protein
MLSQKKVLLINNFHWGLLCFIYHLVFTPWLEDGNRLSFQNTEFLCEYKIMVKFQKQSNPKHNTPLSKHL